MTTVPDITNRPLPTLKQGFTLFDHQVDALEWMTAKETDPPSQNYGIKGGLVCLTMGLGKTLTSIAHSISRQLGGPEKYPTLIIASKTVMYEWKEQGTDKFYDNISTLYLHKDFLGNSIKTITAEEIAQYNIVVTSYDQCVQIAKKYDYHKLVCQYGEEGLQKGKLIAIHNRKRPNYNPLVIGARNIYKIPWARVICDESQRFANPKTYTFKAILAVYGDYKWCLTGTPVRNYDTDVWSQLRFCGYNGVLQPRKWKRKRFAQEKLDRYIYNAGYEDVDIEMVAKIEHSHIVDMDPEQERTYLAMLQVTQDMYDQMIAKYVNFASVLAMFTRLRQTCIAPYLITPHKKTKAGMLQDEIDKVLAETSIEEWANDKYGSAGIDSPKIKKIVQIIKDIPAGEKVIIFSMFTRLLRLVEKAIHIDIDDDITEYIDGTTTGSERADYLTNFKNNKSIKVLLIHYKIGGEGLNITEANHVICGEPWWSPAVENQGIARTWRPQQTKPVHVHRIITNRSIELPIRVMCANKTKLAAYYLNDADYKPSKTGLTKCELLKLIKSATQEYDANIHQI